MKSGKEVEIRKIAHFQGHKDSIYALRRHDVGVFYTASGDGMVAEWEIHSPEQGKAIARLPVSIYALQPLPQHNQLLVFANYFGPRLVDLSTKKERETVRCTDQAIYTCCEIGKEVWFGDAKSNLFYYLPGEQKVALIDSPSDKSARVIAVHPSEKLVAVGYSDTSIRIYDVGTKSMIHSIDAAHSTSIFALAFHPEGDYLVSGGRDAKIKVWDTRTWISQEEIPAHLHTVNTISFRIDGAYFATASKDKSIKIWNFSTGKLIKVIDYERHKGHQNSVNDLDWSGEDQILLSGGDDRSAIAWELQLD